MSTPKDALVISAVGLATTAFTGFSILRALKARSWQPASGRVLESNIERVGDDSDGRSKRSYRLRVRYRYAAGGQEFTGDRLSFFDVNVRHRSSALAAAHRDRIIHGDKIDVWYDPADPSHAVSDRRIPWTFWFAFTIGVIFLLGGALPLLLGRLKG